MNAASDNNSKTSKGLRGWWATPHRTGLQKLINPIEYRHLHTFGALRVAGSGIALVPGFICLSYGVYGWAAFFLAIGVLNFLGGVWYLSIDRAQSAPTRAAQA